ncbi:PepSY-associated TM helix domain-containing protein [Roseomonas sp. 18066]|uniref:PepSY-associated TM helix domain-containing protein n=1 Tax=Roseomonas sp. 18066 TaxID=2681412 RepID=UPI00135BF513|nr:PepSY-associated TM helix domain-containing protein [Roseomonas sp. 18066]
MTTTMQAPGQATEKRGFWLRQLRRWHWISSAICLVGMLLFAVTGFTLNHAGDLPAQLRVTETRAQLPEALRAQLAATDTEGEAPLPEAVRDWIRRTMGVRIAAGTAAEWSADELHVSLPRPGGDAWLAIERETGAVTHELTTRGPVALLNDLHKGRHAGPVWSLFLDVFAVACLVFCVTGLWLLHLYAGNRPSTWPLVGLGLVVPLLIVILFIH